MLLRRVLLVSAAALLTACGASGDDSISPTSEANPTTSTVSVDVADSSPELESVVESTAPPASEDSGNASVAAATPFSDDEPPEAVVDPTNAWISWRSMTSEAIELTWSAPEEAADYQIHRVLRVSDDEPDPSTMTADNLIYSTSQSAAPGDTGERGVITDANVSEGDLYWYGVRGLDTDGTLLSSGWARADAVNDDEPPSPVVAIMTIDDGAVALAWGQPQENHRLHSYRILRRVEGGEFEIVSQTWNLDQTSFVDEDPPDGVDAYAVVAMDFHYNLSELTPLPVEAS